MRTEIVCTTSGLSIGGAPMSRMLQIRVDTTIYFLYTLYQVWRNPIDQVVFLGFQRDGENVLFTHIPYEDDTFAWAARQMLNKPETGLFVLIDGERHAVDVQQLREIDTATIVGPVWCVVANMIRERPYGPGGRDIRRGSKHFAPGARLYCYPALWGDGYERIQVIGRHRATHRYVKMIVSEKWLTNWRVQLVYSPHLIRELWPAWDGTEGSRQKAQNIADSMIQRSMEEHAREASSGDSK